MLRTIAATHMMAWQACVYHSPVQQEDQLHARLLTQKAGHNMEGPQLLM